MAAVNIKPVKVLTDLLTKKQIIKRDADNNTLFNVSGSATSGIVVGHVSSSLPVSASWIYTPDLNISASAPFSASIIQNEVDAYGKYNVDKVLHKMEDALYNVGATDTVRVTESINAYKRLRFQKTGSFDAEGYAEIKLPGYQGQFDFDTLTLAPGASLGTLPVITNAAEGTAADPNFKSFPTSSKDFINLDVMVKDMDDADAVWCNDLLAVNLVVSGTEGAMDELWVKLYAPDLADGAGNIRYRLLAVNEDPDMYIIR